MPLATLDTPAAALGLAEQLFVVDVDTPAGRVTSDVDQLRETADGAYIRVRQAVDGAELAAAPERRVQVDRDGRVTVVHSSYGVGDARSRRRPRGVGGRYVAATLDRCRHVGVSHAIVCAQKVGSYAWARTGFRFDGRTTRRAVAAHVERVADGYRNAELERAGAPAPADPAGLRTLAARVRGGEADAADVAAFGRDTTPGFWHDGRIALLGCHWDGRITFG